MADEKMMTVEEFEAAFGDVELTFSSYYKYEFTFTGSKGDVKISADYGGDSDDIYRYSVRNNEKRNVGNVKDWNRVVAARGDNTIFEYSNW